MLGSSVQGILHDVSQYALESFAMGQNATSGHHHEAPAGMSQAFRLDDTFSSGFSATGLR